MPRGAESPLKKLRKLEEERSALAAREVELRKSASAEVAEIVLDAGGYLIEPGQLSRIIKMSAELGDEEAVRRLEATA